MKVITILSLIFCIVFSANVIAQNPQTEKGLKILFIGDSVTDGNWGGSGKSSERNHWDQNHIFGHGYMYQCAAYYTGNYPENDYKFYNRGISGNTLSDLEARWQEDVLNINPDVLSVLIGINDVSSCINESGSFDFKKWDRKYRNLLDRTLAQHPDLKLILCAPFVSETESMKKNGQWEKYDLLTRQCAAVVQKIAADYNAIYLPFHILFDNLTAKYPEVPASYWLWDGIHPTAAAHQLMADMWIREFAQLVRK